MDGWGRSFTALALILTSAFSIDSDGCNWLREILWLNSDLLIPILPHGWQALWPKSQQPLIQVILLTREFWHCGSIGGESFRHDPNQWKRRNWAVSLLRCHPSAFSQVQHQLMLRMLQGSWSQKHALVNLSIEVLSPMIPVMLLWKHWLLGIVWQIKKAF